MVFPAGQQVIDTMLGIPISADNTEWFEAFKPLLMDEESRRQFTMPAQYMFKDIPTVGPVEDKVAWTLAHMDRHNITRAMIGFVETLPEIMAAYRDHRDRFFFDLPVNPNEGMAAVRQIRRAKREFGIDAVSVFPAGVNPQLPINDKRFYPVYAACAEEGLPIFVNAGVCGPRMPSLCQKVELIEEVVWFFPELKFVMRHGAEPDEALAVKLMLKYPNLYYSTSAFAPKYYPKAIVDFMNSRGASKILYAGYFPMGLSLDRIFAELRELPLKDEVWPKFLYENAWALLGATKS
ncbi:amidohydrolase family protein [Sphingomonas bacterium]|uniref:amidohydrolase family protein n=1 Tax=Sphingomonas bacterium TaxID=1895847 RepID=UPI001575E5BF|nr:amidohydrolase family protein [Sphingomonas bacterium]